MLTALQHHIDEPEDIPSIPYASSQFLQARLNPAYLMRIGTIQSLRNEGFSEQAILGFLEGVTAACEVIELMESAQRQRHEEEQLN